MPSQVQHFQALNLIHPKVFLGIRLCRSRANSGIFRQSRHLRLPEGPKFFKGRSNQQRMFSQECSHLGHLMLYTANGCHSHQMGCTVRSPGSPRQVHGLEAELQTIESSRIPSN